MYPVQELGRKRGGGRIFEGGVLAGHYSTKGFGSIRYTCTWCSGSAYTIMRSCILYASVHSSIGLQRSVTCTVHVHHVMCEVHVAYRRLGNFRSTAHQRKFFNDHCVDNGDVRTSCCYAMVLPTDFKVFFWAVSRCFPTSLVDSRPPDGTESDRDLLGSGSPSTCTGLKNHRRAVVLTDSKSEII